MVDNPRLCKEGLVCAETDLALSRPPRSVALASGVLSKVSWRSASRKSLPVPRPSALQAPGPARQRWTHVGRNGSRRGSPPVWDESTSDA